MKSIELPSITGFGGYDGAGKDNTAEALSELTGVPVVGLGDVLGDIVAKLGHDRDDRVMKRAVSQELAATYKDPAIMANIALGEYKDIEVGGQTIAFDESYLNENGELYITSVRRIAESRAIQKRGGIILWVHAPIELRYERSIARARGSGDAFDSFEDFVAKKEVEMYPPDPTDLTIVNTSRVFGSADYIYNNPDRTPEELKAHLAETFRLPRFGS